MSRNGDTTKFIRILRKAGYDVRKGRSGHYKVYDDGVLITTVSVSPSDRRWEGNARRDIAKYGSKPLPELRHRAIREIME